MRKTLFALLVAAMSAVPAGSAQAQSSNTAEPGEPGEPRAEGPSPRITVKDDRPICRTRARTGTRMGSSRICHTRAEWEALRDQDKDPQAAADALDVLGADDISTGDVGSPMDRTPDTPLGPR